MTEKPFELRYVEAKDLLVNAIETARHKCDVPYIFIDTFIHDIALQVAAEARNEYNAIYNNYQETLNAESENIKSDSVTEVISDSIDNEERF